jgi:hypothetical protein
MEREFTPLPNTVKMREDDTRANFKSVLDLSDTYQIRIKPGYE